MGMLWPLRSQRIQTRLHATTYYGRKLYRRCGCLQQSSTVLRAADLDELETFMLFTVLKEDCPTSSGKTGGNNIRILQLIVDVCRDSEA